jgi:DNA-binding NtrC family response regulator
VSGASDEEATMALRVLILDDEPIVGKRLGPAIAKMGCTTESFTDPKVALARLEEQAFDIIVTDIRMDDIDGISVLERVLQRSPETKVIMITGYATMEVAREALAKGAFDFLAKPFKPGELRAMIARAAEELGVHLERTDPEAEPVADA